MASSRNNLLVSVLMPAYNAQDYIGEAIESILSQTYSNFELLIADDASTDNTKAIITGYAKTDKRVRLIANSKNLYIAANRNKLITEAKGTYVVWADADDISYPERIETQIKILESDASIGICGGSLELFGNKKTEGKIRSYPLADYEARRKIFRYVTVAQPAAMIRREVFDKLGNYDLSTPPAEDLDMLFRIGEKYKFANTDKVVIKYRDNPNSATYQRLRKIELTTLRLRFSYFKSEYYHHSVFDVLYNCLHWLSVWIVPPKAKILLFNLLRNNT